MLSEKKMGSSEVQGKLWGAAAQDWAELFEPASKPIWVAMLDSAEVSQGTRFLDLGCGGGGASVLAAKRGAQVTGLDAAEALINIARERVSDGDFRVGDLEDLPYDDNSFDVAFASLSIMFATNPPVALSEIQRVTVSGGRVTVGIWGKPEDCEYRHILKAVADTLPSPPPGKGPFALSGIGILEGMMEAAGLKVLDSGEVDAPFQFADFEIMWQMVSSVGPIQSAKKVVSERELKAAIMRAAEPFQIDKGEILLNNRFRYVTATA
jgi:SAM-dependent methyltransferase